MYVSHKEKGCAAVGVKSLAFRLPADTTQQTLNGKLKELAQEADVDGILLQLPLPGHLDEKVALDQIPAEKDVDGLSPTNQGLLVCRRPGLFSCTPLGCMELIRSTGTEISGKQAVVIGRSLLVGSPIATMLNHANATVTVVHSRTQQAEKVTAAADILVVAAGVHHMVKKDWIKPGAVVIDVGMHRIEGRLSGDVDFDGVKDVAGWITPVPGGVGPMTITMLLSNCLKANRLRQNL